MMEERFRTPQSFAFLAAAFEGGLALLAVGLGWLLGTPPLETFRWTWPDAGWGALATLPPLGLLWFCLVCPWRPLRRIVQVVDELLVPLFVNCRLAEFAVIAMLAGLGEEMLFRGVLQAAMAHWLGGAAGTWIALLAVGILFGLGHSITFTYAVLAGLIGMYLGAIWIISGNLLVPIIAHAVYDFVALVYLVTIRKRNQPVGLGDTGS
jgi:uncharacterized protein